MPGFFKGSIRRQRRGRANCFDQAMIRRMVADQQSTRIAICHGLRRPADLGHLDTYPERSRLARSSRDCRRRCPPSTEALKGIQTPPPASELGDLVASASHQGPWPKFGWHVQADRTVNPPTQEKQSSGSTCIVPSPTSRRAPSTVYRARSGECGRQDHRRNLQHHRMAQAPARDGRQTSATAPRPSDEAASRPRITFQFSA